MRDNVCYSVSSSTQLYVYPNLSCTEGQPVPSTQSTLREVWNLNDQTNEWYKYQQSNVGVNTNFSGTLTIGHLWVEPSWFDKISPSSLLLPAVIVVLCFFKLIINMYMGVRR